MTYLLELSFGPVQDFISAARRTADLWAGSQLLSTSVRTACNELLAQGAELIYPDPERVRNSDREQSNLSNVILARIAGEEAQVRAMADSAIRAARGLLVAKGEDAIANYPELHAELVRAQLGDALEAYAAWSRLDGEDGYQEAYGRLKAAFSARKNTRDFEQLTDNDHGRPKSGLDGLRETVLPEKPGRRMTRDLHRADGEHLDGLAVLKRIEGAGERFTPLTRLAAHDWLAMLDDGERAALRGAYEPLVALGLATRVKGNGGVYEAFPFDAGLLYLERLTVVRRESESEEERAALAALERAIKPLWHVHGRPTPYAALLMADGDRMGKFIAAAGSAGDHEKITRAVAGFADTATRILRKNGGQVVYAGGEDVMAMLPLSAVLQTPRELAESFRRQVGPLADALKVKEKPTLRVGTAIAHVLEPLGVIRGWADAAEKFAKGEAGTAQQGDALGLVLHIRIGHELALRLPFAQDDGGFAALGAWFDAYRQGAFPARLGYDARAVADDVMRRQLPSGIAEAEFTRLLDRARERSGNKSLDPALVQALKARLDALQGDLRGLGNELIAARWLSARSTRELQLGGRI